MASTVLARTGRHRQRYKGQHRLVAGCIPYKLKPNVDGGMVDLIYRLEVLMISTPNRQDLVFPKGGWENDESKYEAACREALEEAGVRGNISETLLGKWYFKSKSRQNSCSNEGGCKGYMFALEVTEELESWPEQTTHNRKWVSVVDALNLCRYDWMREALASCVTFLSKKLEIPCTEVSELLGYYSMKQPSSMERSLDVSESSSYRFVKPAIDAIC